MEIRQQTVVDLLKKYHEIGSVKDRPRQGRKRTITESDEKRILKKAKKDLDAKEIAQEFAVNESTIRRVLRKHKLRYLTKDEVEELSAKNKEHRLNYAIAMQKYHWKRVLFSDEKTFPLGLTKRRAWQQPGKRQKHYVKRHPIKINVWGAVGQYMKSELFFFRKNMDGPLYQRIIKSRLQEKKIAFAPDCPTRLPGHWVFLQDNDPKHKAKATMALLNKLVPRRIIQHPAQSPDLNIMEDIWSHLDRKVKAAKIKTVKGLQRKLTMEWDRLPWSLIRKSVGSMRARLALCEELQGARTPY